MNPRLPRPGRALFGELGTGEREHVQRLVARPVEQVLDEVKQAGIGPLHVLEQQDRRALLCQALEEDSPGGEEILLVSGKAVFETEQVSDAGPHPGAFLGVGQMLFERRRRASRRREAASSSSPMPQRMAHHLGQCPVRDALSVGEAAAAVPVRVGSEAVDVLLELPRQPRLADSRHPGDEDELGAPLLRGCMEQIFDELKLAVAADERSLEPGRAHRAATAGDHAQCPPELHRLGLALQLVQAGVVVGDRRLGRPLGRLACEDGTGLGGRLDPRRRVDEVARHHALVRRAQRDCCLARENPCSGASAADRSPGSPRRGRSLHERSVPHRPLARSAPPRPPSQRPR